MRHQDRHPAITAGEAGDAVRRAVRVQRVGLRRLPVAIDITQRDRCRRLIGLAGELRPAFAMGHRHRDPRTMHAGQQDRR